MGGVASHSRTSQTEVVIVGAGCDPQPDRAMIS